MLKNPIILFSFFKFIQTGLLFDFFLKKLIEILIRNLYIYSFLFFGEKYIIEYFTKKTIDSYFFNSNKFNTIFNKNEFFIQILILIMYIYLLFYFFIFFI